MKLELAERGHHRRPVVWVRGYDRRANHVPRYPRHLRESSLFTIRLSASGTLFLCVPDPAHKRKPIYVREDVFDILPDEEAAKVLEYIACCNPVARLRQAITNRNARRQDLADGEVAATDLVAHLFTMDVDAAPQEDSVVLDHDPGAGTDDSFWDKEFAGIKAKYWGLGALGAYILFKH